MQPSWHLQQLHRADVRANMPTKIVPPAYLAALRLAIHRKLSNHIKEAQKDVSDLFIFLRKVYHLFEYVNT